MSALPDSSPPRAETLLWLLGTLALAAAPHVERVPLWISVFCLAMGLWRGVAVGRGSLLPGRVVRLALALAGIAGVFTTFGTVFGRDAGIALLLVLLSLKLLEVRTRRDITVVIFLACFLIVGQFLYSQTIFTGLYLALALLAATTTLVDLNKSGTPWQPWSNLRLAAVMLAQALPIMLVLFVLFPRISGPIWGLPRDALGASTGLDDEMAPGHISRLGLSRAVAFRVEFKGTPPAPAERYWRGPVFTLTDGSRWTAGASAPLTSALQVETTGAPVDYTVTLEPHNHTWLFALEIPVTVPDIGRITPEFLLLAKEPLKTRVRYDVTSYPHYRIPAISPLEQRRALQLPTELNPRLRTLAESWRAADNDDQRVVDTALRYFREQPFFYTLNPPLLSGKRDQMDEFLFNTRRGFCEHYASAFTLLMRAAGIPARVITGYQGGEINPLGNYLIVRQSDAHAWAEVWLGERGWVRVDPTAAVSPARVELGVPAPEAQAAAVVPLFELQQLVALQQMGFVWDSVNNTWNLWVLGYGPKRQQQLFNEWGLNALGWGGAAAALLAGLGVPFLLYAAYMLWRRTGGADPVLAAYLIFCRKFARRGITRAPHEGPRDFAARVALLQPALAADSAKITGLYCALRYSAQPPAHALRQLRLAVRAFRA
ncbi:MAG: DUF3488 and transglutaminase-like domain-containing protein [Gammaproteobacteria bacterium]|nr:DUF3488 and transglutaminase-like domain-containing protein [Gammaproteobacteria bacterium]